MKSANTLGITSVVFVLSTLGVPAVHASTVTNNSGTICKNYNAADATKVGFWANGTKSVATTPTKVICPLRRSTTNEDGAMVYVDVKHSVNATTSCTLYSYEWTGALLGSVSSSETFSGFREFVLWLGSGKSNGWSDYSLVCTIPPSGRGVLMGVDLVEY